MSSIKNLKKDINYVLGDVIEYAIDVAALKNQQKEGNIIIDEAIETFDALIVSVNTKKVQNKKAHFKAINADLEVKAKELVEKINSL
ncbi:MAG: ATP adenylyltransferase/5',5'''-P-1,P-4-tetraphosphate phosphorylase II [Maribacter sp.]|jgi:ATP adenylyltransferase/5',5'''-P-1,P-4-tetraphosphate phosphorylase II